MTAPWAQTSPCAKCPFLAKFKGDNDYLRTGRRAEIIAALEDGGTFACHETTVDDEDDDSERIASKDSVECAGATLVLLRAGTDTQQLRIAERLAMFDSAGFLERNKRLELWTLSDCHHDGRDLEVETCNTVDADCLAPAGILTANGSVRYGTESADLECPSCGEAVCSNCADDDGHCGNCTEPNGDDE